MGNCIGKRSLVDHQRGPPTSPKNLIAGQLHCHSHRRAKLVSTLLLPASSSSSVPLNTFAERSSSARSQLSDVKETDIVFSDDHGKNVRKVIQYPSSSPHMTRTPATNKPLVSLPTVSSVQSSSEYKKFKSSKTLINLHENRIKQPFTLIINEEETTMGHLFSKEKDINKANDRRNDEEEETVNIDIKVHIDANESAKENEQYFTIIDEPKMPSTATMVNTKEVLQESLDTSPASSLFDSSLSSLSCNTTPFSSQDRLILSSSPSSSSLVVLSPISSSTSIVPPCQPSRSNKPSQSINSHGARSLTYAEQIYFHHPSSDLVPSKELFTAVLPASASRPHHDFFISEFHQNISSHSCTTLSKLIDDVRQQQFIRIHRSSQVVLIEHQQLQCVHLKDLKRFDASALIFDEQAKVVHATKHARVLGLQAMTCPTQQMARLPKLFSSCDHCSILLSGSKLNQRLRPFLLVNITHDLVQQCFNDTNNNNIFGYVSQRHPTKIRQLLINNSKLAYSYDLDVQQTSFYFVLRVHSWPEELRQTYEERQRHWPTEIETLFDQTCFIRLDQIESEVSTGKKCLTCEKPIFTASKTGWSYTYAAIESALVSLMTDEQIRLASIIWNYLSGKTHGQLPFVVFKHTLFYFFEQYSSDTFITSDLISHAHVFTDFLLGRLQTKSVPHYFNSHYNLYDETLDGPLVQSIAMKMTYLDLKNFPIRFLPKSSLDLYQLIYLIQYQSHFLQCLLACTSSKTNSLQTILDTHELVLKQLGSGIRMYKRQLESMASIKSLRPLTLNCLYAYQEQNVQVILDYLPLLRDKEPSLLMHSFWSMFIQYFNCLIDDLFISHDDIQSQ